jgi:putative peptide maturation system protein
MILIVSRPDDDHVAVVESELRRRGASVTLLDLADLPVRAQLSVEYRQGEAPRPILRIGDSDLDLRKVTAVWSRHPQSPRPDVEITHEALRHYITQETADAWAGTSALLNCLWLPGPHWSEMRAGYKALQLQVAASLGFDIPPTLITNSTKDFLDFYRQHNGSVITKTVHNRLLPRNSTKGYEAFALTEVVANHDLVGVEAIHHCPVTVQPNVEKRVELRITVVGESVFAVEIDSQRTNHTRRDWRRSDPHHGRYAIHKLPSEVARRCVELAKRLGLCFGAVDMILTPEGRYVFLEINPNGEWLLMERTTEIPISAAICDLLMSGEVTPSAEVAPETGFPTTRNPSENKFRQPGVSRAAKLSPAQVRIPHTAVAATLKYLEKIASTGTAPDQALAGFSSLARRHAGTQMDLVWEVETYLGTVHYNALLRAEDGATVSLAVSPKESVPWAFRHAHHARETDLLRVNGRTLNMQTVMGYLDAFWDDARILTRLVDGCLLREAVEARGIEATPAQIQRGLQAFDQSAGLTSRKARDLWLKRRDWSASDLEYEIGRRVIAHKLRKEIVAKKIDPYFAAHRRELDVATIARMRFSERVEARRMASRIQKSTVGFWQAMEEGMASGEVRKAQSELVVVRRRELPASYADVIFAARPGQIVGPLTCTQGADVVRVVRIEKAQLDEPTRQEIMELAFEEWLAQRRSQSVIEWFWGDAERAPSRLEKFTWAQ